MRRGRVAAIPVLLALTVVMWGGAQADPTPPHSEIRRQALFFSGYYMFVDPDPWVVTPPRAFLP